jgi:ClpP class serine protease
LIDGIGTFEDAIEMIKKMANIYDVPKLIYPEEPDSGLLKYFLGDSELSTSFSNFLLYPIPQFRLYYAGK